MWRGGSPRSGIGCSEMYKFRYHRLRWISPLIGAGRRSRTRKPSLSPREPRQVRKGHSMPRDLVEARCWQVEVAPPSVALSEVGAEMPVRNDGLICAPRQRASDVKAISRFPTTSTIRTCQAQMECEICNARKRSHEAKLVWISRFFPVVQVHRRTQRARTGSR